MGYYDTVRDAKQMESLKQKALAEMQAQKEMEQKMAQEQMIRNTADRNATLGYINGVRDANGTIAPDYNNTQIADQLGAIDAYNRGAIDPSQYQDAADYMSASQAIASDPGDMLFTNETGMIPGEGLGINPKAASEIGQQKKLMEAMNIVDQIDAAEEQGVPREELAAFLQQLDPGMQQMVLQAKQLKMQQMQDQLASVRGMVPDTNQTSPVTSAARQILDETIQK